MSSTTRGKGKGSTTRGKGKGTTRAARQGGRFSISDQLHQILSESGQTAYALGLAADLDPGIVQRFLTGRRSLTLASLDQLGHALGLRLVAPPPRRGRAAAGVASGRPEGRGAEVGPPADSPADSPPPPAIPGESAEVGRRAEADDGFHQFLTQLFGPADDRAGTPQRPDASDEINGNGFGGGIDATPCGSLLSGDDGGPAS